MYKGLLYGLTTRHLRVSYAGYVYHYNVQAIYVAYALIDFLHHKTSC